MALVFINCIIHKRWKLFLKIVSKICPCVNINKKRKNPLAATKDASPSSDEDVSSSHSSDDENDIEKANEGSKLLNAFGDIRSVDQSNISSPHTPSQSRLETPSLNTYATNDSRKQSYSYTAAHCHRLSDEERSVHLNFKISFEESLTQLIVKVDDVAIEDDKFLKGYLSVHGALVNNKTRRFQTKTKRSSTSVIFDQIFILTNVIASDIEASKLRIRLYHLESKTAIYQAKRKIAEKIIALHQLPSSQGEEQTYQGEIDTDQKYQLEPFEDANDKNTE